MVGVVMECFFFPFLSFLLLSFPFLLARLPLFIVIYHRILFSTVLSNQSIKWILGMPRPIKARRNVLLHCRSSFLVQKLFWLFCAIDPWLHGMICSFRSS